MQKILVIDQNHDRSQLPSFVVLRTPATFANIEQNNPFHSYKTIRYALHRVARYVPHPPRPGP